MTSLQYYYVYNKSIKHMILSVCIWKNIKIPSLSQRTSNWSQKSRYAFDIWSADQNHALILGLSKNLLCIIHNIPNKVVIIHSCDVFKCVIYVWLIIIYLHIGNGIFCGKGGWWKYLWSGEVVVKLIDLLLIWILENFYFVFLLFLSGGFNLHHWTGLFIHDSIFSE